MLRSENKKYCSNEPQPENKICKENHQAANILPRRSKIHLAEYSDSAEKLKFPSPLKKWLENFFNPYSRQNGIPVRESGECNFFYYMLKATTWRYFSIKGRACRKEFWAFLLLCATVDLSCYYYFMWQLAYNIELKITDVDRLLNLINVLSLVTIIPAVTVTIRRAHDVGLSGWKLFIPTYKVLFLPFVKGDKGKNRFGAPE